VFFSVLFKVLSNITFFFSDDDLHVEIQKEKYRAPVFPDRVVSQQF
jgi:hypothetical protein